MTWLDAIILGIVEGLTEYLPVSSTGHLILTTRLLGLEEGRAVNAYTIVIQLGAILAVLALYRHRAGQMISGLMGRNRFGLELFLKLLLAFIPAAFAGLLLDDLIEFYLFHPIPVAGALMLGGVAMIVVEKFVTEPRARDEGRKLKTLEDMTYLDALVIGCIQCLALWPGTSRSMSTIIGAQLRGFSSVAAAEVSFLLALPTLGGATVYKLVKERDALMEMPGGVPVILVGNVVAFIVAVIAVRFFVKVVTRYGMTPFGVYRIIIGAVFLALAGLGWLHFAPPVDMGASSVE